MRISISNLLKEYTGSIKPRKLNLIYFFIIITWMSLCLSINTKPGEMYQIFDGFVKFINGLRFLVPLIILFSGFVLNPHCDKFFKNSF